MVSERKIRCEGLNEFKKITTTDEKEKISSNYQLKVIDNNLSFDSPIRTVRSMKGAVDRLKHKKLNGEKITNDDLAEFIINNL